MAVTPQAHLRWLISGAAGALIVLGAPAGATEAATDEAAGDSAAASSGNGAADEAGTDATDGQGSTIVVTGRGQSFQPGALRSDIVKTEVISGATIDRLAAQSVNQAVDKNPGIAVQAECSICNVRTITLNNLPGRYTTLEIDGVPLFSSLSSAYGLDSVNVRGVASIDIARGAGASLIAPDALAGVVNVVTKRPREFEAELAGELGNQGSRVATAYVAGPLGGGVSASASASYNRHDSLDADGNGISEYTGFERKMVGGALFGEFGKTTAKLRLDFVDEQRGGGALGHDYAAIKTSLTGNPFDWSEGAHASPRADGWYAPNGSGFYNYQTGIASPGNTVGYNNGRGGFSEIISTKRASAIGTIEGEIAEGWKWRAAAGFAHNIQHSFYEHSTYDATGDQLYTELSLKRSWATGAATLGGNYRYEDLKSVGVTAAGVTNNGLDNYAYKTPGVFAQIYQTLFDEKLEANASLRYDSNNVFGAIWTPRANLLWHHTDRLTSRVAVGTGYRSPTSFFEQDHGILGTTRIVRAISHPEQSTNFSYALNWSDDRLSATVSYNYNRIRHFALLDPTKFDSAGKPITLFTESPNPVTVQGVDATASYQLTPGLLLSLGGEAFSYKFDPGTLVFSRPAWQLYGSVDFDRGPLDLFARVTVTGPHDLAKFYDYAHAQQYNLDGTPMLDKSPVFAVVDLKASYQLSPNLSLYGGADNLFDFRQTKRESPLWLDSAGNIDVTHIWGPLQPRFLYAGVKVSI